MSPTLQTPPPLHDGLAITIRPIRPDDKARLAAGHELMSSETQRLRYLMPKPHLSSAELRYLTEVDGDDHVALVAVADAYPDATLGVGRYIRRGDQPDTAEFAIVIADAFQGIGLGSAIAEQLAETAVEHGIRHFSATVLHENRAVRAVLSRISSRLSEARWSDGAGELLYELNAA